MGMGDAPTPGYAQLHRRTPNAHELSRGRRRRGHWQDQIRDGRGQNPLCYQKKAFPRWVLIDDEICTENVTAVWATTPETRLNEVDRASGRQSRCPLDFYSVMY